LELEAQNTIDKYVKNGVYSEFHALQLVLNQLPSGSKLHSANSLSTRYVNLLQAFLPNDINSFCNRGTSGIDGSNSAAMGHALVDENLQVLVTGDLAFFYDRNGFWHSYSKHNLRIILLNNHGGGIFRVIDGPAIQPELDGYFDSKQSLSAYNTARDFEFDYSIAKDFEDLNTALNGFFGHSTQGKILEIDTEKLKNEVIFRDLSRNWLNRQQS
jgi:2-succinyl-5-enolpyruvyl-6-hydroxy-3-cyclohexene-1-carboxylate synthase